MPGLAGKLEERVALAYFDLRRNRCGRFWGDGLCCPGTRRLGFLSPRLRRYEELEETGFGDYQDRHQAPEQGISRAHSQKNSTVSVALARGWPKAIQPCPLRANSARLRTTSVSPSTVT